MTTAYLPEIKHTKKRGKQLKSISFELGRTNGYNEGKTALSGPQARQGTDVVRSHGNEITERTTMLFENGDTTNGKNSMDKEHGSISEVFSESEQQVDEYVQQTCQPKEFASSGYMRTKTSADDTLELRKLLRQKDREISRFQELIRKMSLDRERAVCSNVNSRMRIDELKDKLSGQHRKVEHVTTVERLRSKQKVNSETERLRQERDEARAQLAQHERLVWQLRKQADHLGYVSQHRYKVIQELGKKMAAKDKSLQELRKRMEQAQLIQICTGGAAERRTSALADARHVAWDTTSRLATGNEKAAINKT